MKIGKLYSPGELAELMSLSRATVCRMINSGVLPAVAIKRFERGTTWRVREDVLKSFLDQRSTSQQNDKAG